jgi:hypothetical protein
VELVSKSYTKLGQTSGKLSATTDHHSVNQSSKEKLLAKHILLLFHKGTTENEKFIDTTWYQVLIIKESY